MRWSTCVLGCCCVQVHPHSSMTLCILSLSCLTSKYCLILLFVILMTRIPVIYSIILPCAPVIYFSKHLATVGTQLLNLRMGLECEDRHVCEEIYQCFKGTIFMLCENNKWSWFKSFCGGDFLCFVLGGSLSCYVIP